MKNMTVGQALNDPTTALWKMDRELRRSREERIARAREIAEREGITLEAALNHIWGVS